MDKHFVRIWSNNFSNAVLTIEAYEELRLQMSSGDFYTHRAQYISAKDIDNREQIFDVDDIIINNLLEG